MFQQIVNYIVSNLDSFILLILIIFYFNASLNYVRKNMRRYFVVHTVIIFYYFINMYLDLNVYLYFVFYVIAYVGLVLYAVKNKGFKRYDILLAIFSPALLNLSIPFVLMLNKV